MLWLVFARGTESANPRRRAYLALAALNATLVVGKLLPNGTYSSKPFVMIPLTLVVIVWAIRSFWLAAKQAGPRPLAVCPHPLACAASRLAPLPS